MDGVLRCSRYAFGPNRLHYCGPDANRTMKEYLDAGESDPALSAILTRFQNLFPYLSHIAEGNGIRDPFDDRVVESYWIGNRLLNTFSSRKYLALLDDLDVKKKTGRERFDRIGQSIVHGGFPHHSFHVLNVWSRTGHELFRTNWSAAAQCLVTWGKVISVSGPFIEVSTEPLLRDERGNFSLGPPLSRKITRSLGADIDIDLLAPGNWITIHWGVPCEVISEEAVRRLRFFTQKSIALSNAYERG
ncbi:MAG: hypothetical protein IPL87_00195 [Candidatus Moraniibacteriota bacterium]|nr:MAG: hypothetical protein IPL87_00195 [Candidatus Moranbacteria bacterium]